MSRNRHALFLALVTALACSSGSKTQTLSKGEVTGLPSGNAVGASFSGTYVITDSVLEGCNCRRGPCSGWHATTGHQLVVKQSDGALEIDEKDSLSSNPCLGGIDKDGKLRCGFSYTDDDFVLLGLWQGSGVAATSLDFLSNLTFVGNLEGQDYDCDVDGHVHAPYVGP